MNLQHPHQHQTHLHEDYPAQLKRRWQTLLIGALTLGTLIAMAATHPTVRHWLTEGASIFFVFGGVVAAPIMSAVAWVGLILPYNVGLHQVAPNLFIIALVWFCLALGGAHAHSLRRAHADRLTAARAMKRPPTAV